MPPGMGHHRPTNISNPFNNFPQPHNSYQSSPYPHQSSNLQSHNFGGHPAFPSAHQNGQVNIFGSGLTNGGVPGNFGGATGLGGPAATGLASQEAQMRFQRGAEMQQAQDVGGIQTRGTGIQTRIREVWKNNLDQEFAMIRSLIDKYPYVSMDTEFPGIVARPMGNFPSKADYHYQCLRCNVDLLKIIQLGITLFSIEGEIPPAHPDTPINRQTYANNLIPCPCTWTFNFKFSPEEDMANEDSITMLRKAGVDFERSAEMGIEPAAFGSLLITSGLVLDKSVTWLSFHSGYDFGYLIKVMAQKQLPSNEEAYLQLVRLWFPRIYDIKYLFRHAQRQAQRGVLSPQGTSIINALGQKSGLQDIADELGCQREGRPHTAGSDAWLTGLLFWQMRRKIFDNQIPEDLVGMIWGLSGVGPPASSGGQQATVTGQQTPSTNGATMYHTGMTPSTHKNDTPSTPQTSHSGLASTPGPHGHAYGEGMTGMSSGGAFGNYQSGVESTLQSSGRPPDSVPYYPNLDPNELPPAPNAPYPPYLYSSIGPNQLHFATQSYTPALFRPQHTTVAAHPTWPIYSSSYVANLPQQSHFPPHQPAMPSFPPPPPAPPPDHSQQRSSTSYPPHAYFEDAPESPEISAATQGSVTFDPAGHYYPGYAPPPPPPPPPRETTQRSWRSAPPPTSQPNPSHGRNSLPDKPSARPRFSSSQPTPSQPHPAGSQQRASWRQHKSSSSRREHTDQAHSPSSSPRRYAPYVPPHRSSDTRLPDFLLGRLPPSSSATSEPGKPHATSTSHAPAERSHDAGQSSLPRAGANHRWRPSSPLLRMRSPSSTYEKPLPRRRANGHRTS